eukprot:4316932-Amphidinium_carterae.2
MGGTSVQEGAAGALKAQSPELMVSTVYRHGAMTQEGTAEMEISNMVSSHRRKALTSSRGTHPDHF